MSGPSARRGVAADLALATLGAAIAYGAASDLFVTHPGVHYAYIRVRDGELLLSMDAPTVSGVFILIGGVLLLAGSLSRLLLDGAASRRQLRRVQRVGLLVAGTAWLLWALDFMRSAGDLG